MSVADAAAALKGGGMEFREAVRTAMNQYKDIPTDPIRHQAVYRAVCDELRRRAIIVIKRKAAARRSSQKQFQFRGVRKA